MLKLFIIIMLMFSAPLSFAQADGEDGIDGIDGIDGADGADGIDGIDGLDGIDGIDGLNGIDGIDGAIGPRGLRGDPGKPWGGLSEFINRSHGEFYKYLAATSAAQIYLPQYNDERITFGVSTVGGRTGVGIGYAKLLDSGRDEIAFTLSLGVSGGEVAGTASLGFEF